MTTTYAEIKRRRKRNTGTEERLPTVSEALLDRKSKIDEFQNQKFCTPPPPPVVEKKAPSAAEALLSILKESPEAKDLLKSLLKDNLTISLKEERGWYNEVTTTVSVDFDGEQICSYATSRTERPNY